MCVHVCVCALAVEDSDRNAEIIIAWYAPQLRDTYTRLLLHTLTHSLCYIYKHKRTPTRTCTHAHAHLRDVREILTDCVARCRVQTHWRNCPLHMHVCILYIYVGIYMHALFMRIYANIYSHANFMYINV